MFDDRAEERPVFGFLQATIRRRRAGGLVVDEKHAVPDEDLVLDLDALADEAVALELAAAADARPSLDLDERADSRPVPIVAAVEVRERGDLNVVTERDPVDAAGTARRWPAAQPSKKERTPFDDRRKLVLADPREDRQREALAGERLGDRERPRR